MTTVSTPLLSVITPVAEPATFLWSQGWWGGGVGGWWWCVCVCVRRWGRGRKLPRKAPVTSKTTATQQQQPSQAAVISLRHHESIQSQSNHPTATMTWGGHCCCCCCQHTCDVSCCSCHTKCIAKLVWQQNNGHQLKTDKTHNSCHDCIVGLATVLQRQHWGFDPLHSTGRKIQKILSRHSSVFEWQMQKVPLFQSFLIPEAFSSSSHPPLGGASTHPCFIAAKAKEPFHTAVIDEVINLCGWHLHTRTG